MVRLILYSCAATVLSIVIGFAGGVFIPVELKDESLSTQHTDIVRKPIYTEQDLKEAKRNLDEKLERLTRQEMSKPPSQRYARLRYVGSWMSWIPWLVLPFTLKMNRYVLAIPILVIPTLLTISRILLPVELLLSVIAVLLAIFGMTTFNRTLSKRGRADEA